MVAAFFSGMALGMGLIVAIGAQNAYLLRLGLLRAHVLPIVLFCATSDALLIAAGVMGAGALVQAQPALLFWIAIGGAIFLFAYGLLAARRALNPNKLAATDMAAPSLMKALSATAAFTWLNPHVYLDTVVLMGGFSARYAGDAAIAFGAGGATGSFVWFFVLGYGARLLSPVFARPKAWRVLDSLIAAVMFLLAWSLVQSAWASVMPS